MRPQWFLLSLFMLAWLPISQAHAAVVAVMPVRGVNLSPGECDAIGMLFAEAFAQEAHVEVLTPMKTGPAIQHSGNSQAAAAQLEAAEYIELSAIRLDRKVKLGGIRFDRNGAEVFRAETVAPLFDQMNVTSAQLAHALAWPIPKPAPSDVSPGPYAYTKALGIKVGVSLPLAQGRSFYPVQVLAFDARLGTRNYFVEFGGGVNISPATRTTASRATMEAWFTEVGGSAYLSSGAIAPYLGVGISPRFAFIDGARKDDGVRLAVYGQTGVTFTRDSRFKFYGELRVSQNLLEIPEYASDGTTRLRTYHPTEIALQAGVGW
jgi:hypothetical protein